MLNWAMSCEVKMMFILVGPESLFCLPWDYNRAWLGAKYSSRTQKLILILIIQGYVKAYILGSQDKIKDINTNTFHLQITRSITDEEQSFVTLRLSKNRFKCLNKMWKGSIVVNKIQYVWLEKKIWWKDIKANTVAMF